MQRTCKQCGKTFELSQSEIDFYNRKGLSLPKRCKECRAQNKENEQTHTGEPEKIENVDKRPAAPQKKPMRKLIGIIGVIVLALLGGKFAPVVQNGNDMEVQTDPIIVSAESKAAEQATSTESQTAETEAEPQTSETKEKPQTAETQEITYKFRSKKLLNQHYEKHGIEMGFDSAAAYQEAASAVIKNPDALYKTEKEDGDGVYYVEATNEFVILSTDGYIRTYFNPDGGIDYFNRQ